MRCVVILFGPPAAGKSTIARSLGLEVYDRDDPPWHDLGETPFRQALQSLRLRSDARAVAIRQGATRSARSRSIAEMAATDAFLVATPMDVCLTRAADRGRDPRREPAAIRAWFQRFDRGGDVPLWTGAWRPPIDLLPDGTDVTSLLGSTSRSW
jgi:GTPase SAR1 family protein